MAELAKVIGLIIASGLKFFLAPTATVLAGYSFIETICITISGGFLGFVLFFKFGTFIGKLLKKYFPSKEKPRFTRKNRFIVKIKSKYGLYGIALLTPCLFSIPLGAILASLFYSKDKRTIPMFTVSIVIWSLVLTSLTSFFAE